MSVLRCAGYIFGKSTFFTVVTPRGSDIVRTTRAEITDIP
jgi:hypothetical protein